MAKLEDEEKLYSYQIPENILESRRFWGFRKRNWIEGLICVFITGFIICLIPFVTRVKLIFLICICGSVLLLNLVGIRDQSLFEVIQNLRIAKDNSGQYHLRRPDNEEKYKTRRVAQSINGIGNGDSAADKVSDFAKAKYKEIKEQFQNR